MRWFKSLSFLAQLGIYAAVAFGLCTAITASYLSWRHTQRMIGWNDALAAVAEQNATAKKAANDVKRKLDECFTMGGNWNVSTGRCDR